MNASMFVGRVGGLAVALGVGVALLSGPAVAFADRSGADTGDGGRASSSSSGDGSSAPPATPRGRRGAATDASEADAPVRGRPAPAAGVDAPEPEPADSGSDPAAAAQTDGAEAVPTATTAGAEESTPIDTTVTDTTVTDTTDITVTEIDTAPADSADSEPPTGVDPGRAEPTVTVVTITDPVIEAPQVGLPAPESAPADDVSGFLSGTADPTDGAGSGPSVPVDSPLAWTMLAFSRRNALGSASIDTAPAAVTTTAQPSIPSDPLTGIMDLFNVSVSFSGVQLLQIGSANAHTSGMGSFAIAFLPDSVASADGQGTTAQAFGYHAATPPTAFRWLRPPVWRA